MPNTTVRVSVRLKWRNWSYVSAFAISILALTSCGKKAAIPHETKGQQENSDAIRAAVAQYQKSLRDLNRGRVVGGQFAKPGELPWQAAIVSAGWAPKDGIFCGGTVIASSWIVTAAHCFPPGVQEGDQYIFVGPVDLTTKGETLDIARIYSHERFNRLTFDDDIALLRLKSDTKTAIPIGLLNSVDATVALAPRRKGRVSGWGKTAENGSKSVLLKYVDVPFAEQSNCVANYKKQNSHDIITANMVCAGFDTSDLGDACSGDSGGPLVVPVDNGNSFRLAGAVSWGEGCSRKGLYGVYTRIPIFVDWVKAYTDLPAGKLPPSANVGPTSSPEQNPRSRTIAPLPKTATKGATANAPPAEREEWMTHIDWSIGNTDAGGATDCPAQYPDTACILVGGRACLMTEAINAAKAGTCAEALKTTLVTQCHNPHAQQTIIAAGEERVCAYLKAEGNSSKASTPPGTEEGPANARSAHREEWMTHIDWSIRNTDAGGATNCPGLYPYPGCILIGGRACLMTQAINAAKAGRCTEALRTTLVTQCHNPKARQTITAAGEARVCAYLKDQ